jgi:hypothetical protein
MRKAGAIIFLLFMGLPILLAAQEEDDDDDPSGGSDWDYYYDESFTRGDQTFIISLGTVFPTVFFNDGQKIDDHKFSPPVGGTGSLSYNFYLTPKIFIGGEVGGMFVHTLGGNTLFVIPVGARAGYQFNVWRFEFPLTGVVGMVWHRYLDFKYYGLYLKGGGAAFFRATPSWSFGMNANWFWFPQWTDDTSKNVFGNIVDLTLCARYHF